jgi:ankyrin repeat protein
MNLFSNLTANNTWLFPLSRLCNACKNGDLETVKKLATSKNVNDKGWMGWPPVIKAAEGANLEVVQFLVNDLQADVNNADSSKQTSLHVLAGVERETQRHIQTMAFLLEKGANPNAEADDQYTPLHMATLNNNIEMVKLLLQHKANVNAQNMDQYTALHTAYRYGLRELIDILLQHGADTTIKDGQGLTPIQVAQKVLKSVSAAPPPPVTTNPEKPAEQTTNNNSAPSNTNTTKPAETSVTVPDTPVIVETVNAAPVKQNPPTTDEDEAARLQQEIEKELQDVS